MPNATTDTKFQREEFVGQMLPKGSLNPHALACALYVLSFCGIRPPNIAALQTVIESDPDALTLLNSYYPDEGFDEIEPHDFDTVDDEMLRDVVAQHFIGRSWPRYGDGEAFYSQFTTDLVNGLRAQGWSAELDKEKA